MRALEVEKEMETCDQTETLPYGVSLKAVLMWHSYSGAEKLYGAPFSPPAVRSVMGVESDSIHVMWLYVAVSLLSSMFHWFP